MSDSRVLIAQHRPQVARALLDAIKEDGNDVTIVGNSGDCVREAAQIEPHLIIVETDLPGAGAIGVIRATRQWSSAAIYAISNRYSEKECIEMLDEGADDYLPRPFRIGELRARVRSSLRGFESEKTNGLEFCDIRFERDTLRVVVQGRRMALAPKEYALLFCLARNCEKVVTYKQLLAAAWDCEESNQQLVRNLVALIRRKLKEGGCSTSILTVEGKGYRLTGEFRPEHS